MTIERILIDEFGDDIDPLTLKPEVLFAALEAKEQADRAFIDPCPDLTIDPELYR